jgi:hypothetical protein
LVMMFHPTGPMPAAAAADGKDFKDSPEATDFKDVDGGHSVSEAPAAAGSQPLQVSEITGYGNIPPGTDVSTTPPLLPPPGGAPGGPGGMPVPPISPPGSGVITP